MDVKAQVKERYCSCSVHHLWEVGSLSSAWRQEKSSESLSDWFCWPNSPAQKLSLS